MTKIVFMGTPSIAVPTLELLNNQYNVAAVVTVPDKPQGRGMRLAMSPIKHKAQELNIETLQPDNLLDSDFINKIKTIAPDLIVVFAFRFLPKEVYTLSKVASFNIHTSLLPDYRGAAPINWAIINGESATGLTAFILEDRIDGGPIIMQHVIPIPVNCTAGELYSAMMAEAPNFTANVCNKLITNNFELTYQTKTLTKLAPKVFKQTAKIDWSQPAQVVINFINGHSPQPGAWTNWNNGKLQIFRVACATDATQENHLIAPGDYFILKKTILVLCGDGNMIELHEIKPENKNCLSTKDFINGYKGERTGSFAGF